MASRTRLVASSLGGFCATNSPSTSSSVALRQLPRWALRRKAAFSTVATSRRAAVASAIPSRIHSRGLATPVEIEDEGGFNLADVERAQDEVDVCIVGGGPAGLSAAIRLKQLEQEKGREIRVVVLEKGAEAGKFLEYLVIVWILASRVTLIHRFTHSFRRCDRDKSLG